MKTIRMVVLIGLLAGTLLACSKADVKAANLEGTLEEIMANVYDGIEGDLPKLSQTVVDDDTLAYFVGTEDLEYEAGLASEPMMSSIAHSVVLLRVKEGADMAAVKSTIKANVDPRKWICVGVEEDQVIVDSVGDVVILIMASQAADLHQSFLKLQN